MITVAPQQSMLDIALQHAGGAEAVFELAGTNTISITDDLGIGQQLVATPILSKEVTNYYAVHNICPATAITNDTINEILGDGEGIEFWAIEYDFVVS